jgi:putative transposase
VRELEHAVVRSEELPDGSHGYCRSEQAPVACVRTRTRGREGATADRGGLQREPQACRSPDARGWNQGKRRKCKATTDSKHELPVAPNVLEQQFAVESPNDAWVSDITHLWMREGWMYLAVIIDLFSRRVVGWSLGERMTAGLVCSALDSAVGQRHPASELIFHSDRGSPGSP